MPDSIKLDGSPKVSEERTGKMSWTAKLNYFVDGMVETARDIWDEMIGIVEKLIEWLWKSG